MTIRKFLIFMAIASLFFALTACGGDDKKEIELAGTAWSGFQTAVNNDGTTLLDVTFICASASEGTLFIKISETDCSESECLVVPFGYTWNDNQGTVSGTYQFSYEKRKEGGSESSKGTITIAMTIGYTDAEGLTLDLGNAANVFELPVSTIRLSKKNIAKPSAMTGTQWVSEFDGTTLDWDFTQINVHYRYVVNFVSTTAATISMTMAGSGDDVATEQWNATYTYGEGVGHTQIIEDGDCYYGGFFLTDASHMVFSDGETGMDYVKQ